MQLLGTETKQRRSMFHCTPEMLVAVLRQHLELPPDTAITHVDMDHDTHTIRILMTSIEFSLHPTGVPTLIIDFPAKER